MEVGWRVRPAMRGGRLALALPAPILVLVTLGILFVGAFVTSLASLTPTYGLQFWPPSGAAYESFFAGFAPAFIVGSVGTIAVALAIVIVPSGIAGYFLAVRAPPWFRNVGVFLLLGGWALLPIYGLAVAPFLFEGSPFFGWLPGAGLGLPDALPFVVAYGMAPMVTLGAYSGFRGDLFGLAWPRTATGRKDRLLLESIPRGVAGLAAGAGIAAAYMLMDPLMPSLYGGSTGPGAGVLLYDYFQSIYAPSAGVVSVVSFAILSVLLVLSVAAVLLCRWGSIALDRHPEFSPYLGRDRIYSVFSFWAGIIATALILLLIYAPLVVLVLYSFTSTFDFSSWTIQWYFGSDPETAFAIRGVFGDLQYLESLLLSIGFAAGVALPGAGLAVLVVRNLRHTTPARRFLVRVSLFAPLFVPAVLLFVSGAFVLSSLASAARDPWPLLLGYGLAYLPFAIAVGFVVLSASGTWHNNPILGPRLRDWAGPFVAAAFVAFAFLFSFAWWSTAGEGPWATYVYSILARRAITPFVHAAMSVPAAIVVLSLALAWAVFPRRDLVRF